MSALPKHGGDRMAGPLVPVSIPIFSELTIAGLHEHTAAFVRVMAFILLLEAAAKINMLFYSDALKLMLMTLAWLTCFIKNS